MKYSQKYLKKANNRLFNGIIVWKNAGGIKLLKAVLFDLDGTLIDSEHFYIHIWLQVLTGYGLSPEADLLISQLGGKTIVQAYDVLQSEYGFSGDRDELFFRIHQTVEIGLQTEIVRLMPGVKELIHYLNGRKIRMAVVTSSDRRITELHLGRHQLLEHFEFLVTRNDVEHTKPAPDPYLKALNNLGLPAGECLVLEDSPTGLAAARAAGLPCVCIQHVESIRKLLPPDTLLFHHLFEARGHLEGLR